MNEVEYNEVKDILRKSIFTYISHVQYTTKHPLDLLIPKQRKIRSIVGGLETSMGTTIWEPLAKKLAERNGFEIVKEKILKPDPFPEEMAIELGRLITLRENSSTWISIHECIARLRELSLMVDRSKLSYIAPAAGTGVDIRLRKDKKDYAFDTKTVQPNLGAVKSFNKEILEWYAYALCKDPKIDITCRIAYPYNPHPNSFWTYTPHTKGVLEPGVDAVVEDEFWDFISGHTNTYALIESCFKELNDEGFGADIAKMIENS